MPQFIFLYIFLDKLLIIYILACIFIVIPYYYIPYSLFKQTKKQKKRKRKFDKIRSQTVFIKHVWAYIKKKMIYLIAVN